MNCPKCKQNGDEKVIDSRDHGDWIRRRRKCLACGETFTTYETISLSRQVGPPPQPFPIRSAKRIKVFAEMIVKELESPDEPSLAEQILALQRPNELVKRTT